MKPVILMCALLAFASGSLRAEEEPRDWRPWEAANLERRVDAPAHVLIETEHTLLAEEMLEMRSGGVEVLSALGGNRYLARLDRGAVQVRPIVTVSPIEPALKIAQSVWREAARLGPFSSLRVVFHPDVSLETATRILEANGAIARDPSRGFGMFNSVEAYVPDRTIERVAESDEVRQISGPPGPFLTTNAAAAELSGVTSLYSAPYGLSGQGVLLSQWDEGRADESHREFGGRLLAQHSGSTNQHATHVAGTLIASGLRADARGMAPEAQVLQYNFFQGNWWDEKASAFSSFDVRADNNSWGYGLGWSQGGRTYWEWWGDELFGAYAFESAAIDRLTRDHGVLIVFSAGNENSDRGPESAPWPHYHGGGSKVYCSSRDGSGSDCPGSPCQECESTRHPSDGPFNSLSINSTTKNGIVVGAVGASKNLAGFSSRGPTADGRVKPDVVALGLGVLSTLPGNRYGESDGTSMSTPVVTGIAALLIEQWRLLFEVDPDPAVLRALLIHEAEDLGNPGPDYRYGFGLVRAQRSVDLIIEDGGTGSRIRTGMIEQGMSIDYPVNLEAGDSVRITLVWPDPEVLLVGFELADTALINDLDLRVIDPDHDHFYPFVLDPAKPDAAATTGVNLVDNAEQIVITGATAGEYRVRVSGSSVPEGPQSFVLVSDRDLGDPVATCSDPYEPNDQPQKAWRSLKNGVRVRPVICDGDDIDYFAFTVDRSGEVSIKVWSTDTPLLVTLQSDATGTETVDVPAGGSGFLSVNAGTGTGVEMPEVQFTVIVQPNGEVGATGNFAATARYETGVPPRRRGAVR